MGLGLWVMEGMGLEDGSNVWVGFFFAILKFLLFY